MHTKGYSNIPGELFYYITFLTRALPLRSAKTFIELLMGSLLTQSGFVTSAIWIVDMARQWPGYYKWLETGQWSYLKLMRQWTALPLLLRLTPQAGNIGKLVIARSLIRALLEPLKDKAVTVLVDSWYMRRSFIEPVQAYNMTVIGQVRIDTVLYKRPW